MKSIYKKVVIGLVSVLLLQSCTERINLSLNNSDPKLVIEGEVTDQPGPYYIKCSMSQTYNGSNIYTLINPQWAIISDNTGVVDTLVKYKDGYYQTTKLVGQVGKTYYLKVVHSGVEYTASSTMNAVPEIDSTSTLKLINFYYANAFINDPAGVKNYYRYHIKVNGKSPKNIYPIEDRLFDGKPNYPITANLEQLELGDSIDFSLLAIDKANYDYFVVAQQNNTNNNNQNAAPANPTSNITNASLGYFSAHAIRTKSFKIK
jgi:hypothetical protein